MTRLQMALASAMAGTVCVFAGMLIGFMMRPVASSSRRPPVQLPPPGGVHEPALIEVAPEPGFVDGGCQEQLEECTFNLKVAEGRLFTHEGNELEWPANIATWATPEELRAQIDADLNEADFGRLHTLDCSEYPCIAVVEGDLSDLGWANIVGRAAAQGELANMGPDVGSVPSGYTITSGQDRNVARVIRSFPDRPLSVEEKMRVEFRTELLKESSRD